MDQYPADSPLGCESKERVQVPLVGMNPAVRHKTNQVKRPALAASTAARVHRCGQRLVAPEFTARNSSIDAS